VWCKEVFAYITRDADMKSYPLLSEKIAAIAN